jgi:hypothetical protein
MSYMLLWGACMRKKRIYRVQMCFCVTRIGVSYQKYDIVMACRECGLYGLIIDMYFMQ